MKETDNGTAAGHRADIERILQMRAARLAQRPQTAEDGETLEVVEFRIAEERYAVESLLVREVLPLRNMTPLPCTPDFVLGIINVRGQILSVVDLRTFFELPRHGLRATDRVLILHNADMEFGVLAEAIDGARHIQKRDIRPALPTMTDVREDFILGVTREQCVVLNGNAILADRRIFVEG